MHRMLRKIYTNHKKLPQSLWFCVCLRLSNYSSHFFCIRCCSQCCSNNLNLLSSDKKLTNQVCELNKTKKTLFLSNSPALCTAVQSNNALSLGKPKKINSDLVNCLHPSEENISETCLLNTISNNSIKNLNYSPLVQNKLTTIERQTNLTFAPNLSLSLLVKDYGVILAGLSKARLSGLVVSTALVGCALGSATSLVSMDYLLHPFQVATCLGLGTALTSAAANTINQIIEIPYDSQMIRTRNRVLVRGLTTPCKAAQFAFGCTGLGLSLLYFGVNPLVMSLAMVNMLLYTCIYTPLKQISQANTWIGALVGAIPPLMGWAAATGELQSGSLILASLLYSWQFPHFMALSWNLKNEYSKAGYSMTSVLDPDLCKRVALRHSIGTCIVCLGGAGCSAISLGPWAGCVLGMACLPANIGLVYYAWKFAKSIDETDSSITARQLFRATLFHLPIVLGAVVIATYLCSDTEILLN